MRYPTNREPICLAAILLFIASLYIYHTFITCKTTLDSINSYEIDTGDGTQDSVIASPFDLVNGSLKFTSQDDIRILNYIRKYHLQPPSPGNEAYNITLPVHNGGVLQYITKLFNNKRGGIFVECGAYNGELLSNSLLLEKDYGWTGLLVEADQGNLKSLEMKRRKAWIADICLSPFPYPVQLSLGAGGRTTTHLVGYFFKKLLGGGKEGQYITQCFPLYSVLRAMNLETVDYFSLDVEGAELPILKTFPFDDKLIIKVISLEYRGNKLEEFDFFLGSKGYRRLAAVNESYHTMDAIYAHESFPG